MLHSCGCLRTWICCKNMSYHDLPPAYARFVSGAAEASAPTRAALVGLGYPDVHVAYFAHHGRIPGSVSAAAADVRGDHLALGCGSDGDGRVFSRSPNTPPDSA